MHIKFSQLVDILKKAFGYSQSKVAEEVLGRDKGGISKLLKQNKGMSKHDILYALVENPRHRILKDDVAGEKTKTALIEELKRRDLLHSEIAKAADKSLEDVIHALLIYYERTDDLQNVEAQNAEVVYDEFLQKNQEVVESYDTYKKSLLEKAENGDAQAQYLLSYNYMWGHISFGSSETEDRYEQAYYWATKAVENGYIGANDILGRLHFRGAGVNHNLKKSYQYHKITADSTEAFDGYAVSCSHVAHMSRFGLGCIANLELAEEYYLKAIELGATNVHSLLCNMYLTSGQYEKALERFEKVEETDEADSYLYFQIASYYYYGVHEKKPNYELAQKYFGCSADKGNANAMAILGDMYFHGTPRKSLEQAAFWYRKAAEGGNARGQYVLGVFYEYGLGIEQDYAEALKWYLKAVENGDNDAHFQRALFSLVKSGNIMPDFERAFTLMKKYAEQGGAVYACTKLGEFYEAGIGCKKNETEAQRWFKEAARRGDETAKIYIKSGSPLSAI